MRSGIQLGAASLAFSLLALPALAQQPEPEIQTEAQQAEPPAEAQSEDVSQAELKKFYDERLKTAPPKIKEFLARLAAQRSPGLTFQMGYTSALDRSLSELTGARPEGPPPEVLRERMEQGEKALRLYESLRSQQGLPERRATCSVNARSFTWREVGKVTGIRDQMACGSCWAFAGAAALESSYLIEDGREADASEQDILNCSSDGDCGGGYLHSTLDQLIVFGSQVESAAPYQGRKRQCANRSRPIRGVAWAPLDANWARVIPPNEMKKALCRYGPITTRMIVTPTFQAYTGGVYSQIEYVDYDTPGAHFVVITGWDDSRRAWRIKNSWGPWWGERGFGWIRYNANLIGHNSSWILAPQRSVRIQEEFSSLYRQFIPMEANPQSDEPEQDEPPVKE